MKVFSNLLIVVLAIFGIADAGYISQQQLTNQIPPCMPGFQCEVVLTSPYANIGPISLSMLGIFYYALMLILAIWTYLETPLPNFRLLRKSGIQPLDLLQISSWVGFAFSIYLVFIMGVVIQAWCTFCLISAITCFLLLISTWWHSSLRRTGDSYFIKGVWLNFTSCIYQHLLKPIFFAWDPEKTHERMIATGAFFGGSAMTRKSLEWMLGFRSADSAVRFAGISFPNRIGLSAGYDYTADLTQTLASVGFGWQTVGTITLEPYGGNEPPRLQRLKSSQALLVNKGLKNPGAAAVIKKLEGLAFPIPVAISIASTNKQYHSTKEQIMDIIHCFFAFEHSRVNHALYELNISCPNTFGGEPFTTCPRLDTLLTALDQLTVTRPIFIKMPIDQSEAESLAMLKTISEHKIAGVILGNLTKDHTNPAVTKEDRAIWSVSKGNVSGKPTYERSNRLIALTKKRFGSRFVIVGTGGIFSPEDAAQKIALGADLVQLITGMIYQGPQLIGLLNRELTYPDGSEVASGKSKQL